MCLNLPTASTPSLIATNFIIQCSLKIFSQLTFSTSDPSTCHRVHFDSHLQTCNTCITILTLAGPKLIPPLPLFPLVIGHFPYKTHSFRILQNGQTISRTHSVSVPTNPPTHSLRNMQTSPVHMSSFHRNIFFLLSLITSSSIILFKHESCNFFDTQFCSLVLIPRNLSHFHPFSSKMLSRRD